MTSKHGDRPVLWDRFTQFMRCVYRHDQRVWMSIFGRR